MAYGGGIFDRQDKPIAGTYIAFVGALNKTGEPAERGVATVPLELDWGAEGVTEITSSDFSKKAQELFGYAATHEKLKPLADFFKNAQKGFIYKLNTNSAKATNKFADAKNGGIRGNNIKVAIKKSVDDATFFDVETYLDNWLVDRQVVKVVGDLKDNAYITWKNEALEVTAGLSLSGGTNGDPITGASYQKYLDAMESYAFNTMGLATTDKQVKGLAIAYAKRLRDEVGLKFQIVLFDKADANYEGVISVENKTVDGGEADLVYWATGKIASCRINTSNANEIYNGAYEISADYTQKQLEQSVAEGKFMMHRVGDTVRVFEDINTLVSVTEEKGAEFKMNQTIRIIDYIATSITKTFNDNHLGKTPANKSGRVAIWNDVVRLFKGLQELDAIEGFNATEDVEVLEGDDKYATVVNSKITIVGMMRQLYMTVLVK